MSLYVPSEFGTHLFVMISSGLSVPDFFLKKSNNPMRSTVDELVDAVECCCEDIDRRQADHAEMAGTKLWRETGAMYDQDVMLV
jgi:hypothetical protein